MYEDLKQHIGWRRLRDHLGVVRESFLQELASRMLSSPEPADQRRIDYMRGFFAGAEHLLKHPEDLESQLEKAARKAFERAQDDLYTDQEDELPYE